MLTAPKSFMRLLNGLEGDSVLDIVIRQQAGADPAAWVAKLERMDGHADQGAYRDAVLALFYIKGIGVAANEARAFELTQRAARTQWPNAVYMLAVMCLHGRGVAHAPEDACTYIRRAAELGVPEAMTLQAYLTSADERVAFEWALRAATLGEVHAMAMVAWCYKHGKGCTRNDDRAVIFEQKAAAAGGATGCGDESWEKSTAAVRELVHSKSPVAEQPAATTL